MAGETMCRSTVAVVVIALFFFASIVPSVSAQAPAPAPATGDGTTIDQGIAYVLMLVALVLTYIIHSFDGPSSYRLF